MCVYMYMYVIMLQQYCIIICRVWILQEGCLVDIGVSMDIHGPLLMLQKLTRVVINVIKRQRK